MVSIKTYTYAMLQRPPMPGAMPKKGLVEVQSFDKKEPVVQINKMAWGILRYDHPLTDREIDDYELAKLDA